MSSAYEPTRLIEDLHELHEELEVAKAIAQEEQSEREVLVETKSLLVLQSQRHAAELPSECGVVHAAKCSHRSYYIPVGRIVLHLELPFKHRIGVCLGLERLLLEKQKADEKMVELRKARAKEDADFAAAEAAAAAEEWKQVYALRIEREEADRRAAEAAEKLKQVEQEAARRYGLVPDVVLNLVGLNSGMHFRSELLHSRLQRKSKRRKQPSPRRGESRPQKRNKRGWTL